MRLLIQRVKRAQLTIEGRLIHALQQGLVVLVGFAPDDHRGQLELALNKVTQLRVFADAAGKTNLSLSDIQGGLLLVPNFTLYADASRGRRPSFGGAAPPEHAAALFAELCERSTALPLEVGHGQFGADMQVELVNDGPFTVILDI